MNRLLLFLVLVVTANFVVAATVQPDNKGSSCTTAVCTIVQWLLEKLGWKGDLGACEAEFATAEKDFQAFASEFRAKDYENALKDLNNAFEVLSTAVKDCDVPDVAKVFEKIAKLFGEAEVKVVDDMVEILVAGSDAYQDLYDAMEAFEKGDYKAFAADVAKLVNFLEPYLHGCKDDKICQILVGILEYFKIAASDFSGCKSDFTQVESSFTKAIDEFNGKDYKAALEDLATGLKYLGDGISDCGVPELADLLQKEAALLGLGNITIVGEIVEIMVEGADLYDDLYAAVKAFETGDYQTFGNLMSKIIDDIRKLGCKGEACEVIEAILEALEIFMPDLRKCEVDIKLSWSEFEQGAALFKQKDYEKGLGEMATGLKDLGGAIKLCDLPQLANLLVVEAEKLGLGNISIVADIVKILVDGNDVYDDIFAAVDDFVKKDYKAVGKDLGDLIAKLRSFGCTSPVCIIVEGILEALEAVIPDLKECSEDLTTAETYFVKLESDFDNKQYEHAVVDLFTGLDYIAKGVEGCGLKEVMTIIEQEAEKLKWADLKYVEEAVLIIVEGADIYDDLFQAVEDFKSKDYKAAGADIGEIIQDLKDTGCKTPVCEIIEGILEVLEIVVDDFGQCGRELDRAWYDFEVAAHDFKHKDYHHVLTDLSAAFANVADAVQLCEVPELATVIINIAKLFHLGHTEDISGLIKMLVAGADMYKDLEGAYKDWENQDYKGFGRELGKIIKEISDAAGGKCKDEKWCFFLTGILQGLNIIPDFKLCKDDVEKGWELMGKTCHDFHHHHYKNAVHDLAHGLDEFALGVQDCDLAELEPLLAKLAEKLFGCEISWLEELIHIIVDGADIYDDCYNIYWDYENDNILGLGIDIAKLIKLLV